MFIYLQRAVEDILSTSPTYVHPMQLCIDAFILITIYTRVQVDPADKSK